MPDMINPADVKTMNSPGDPLSRPITTGISQLDFLSNGVRVSFSKKDGGLRWPDVTPPGWSGPLQYTLWLFLNISGQWYGSGIIQFWYGLDASGGNVTVDDQIALNWVYDSRWGAMAGHQPAPGETVGFMVSAGNQRGQDDKIVAERSNIVTVPFPAGVPQTIHFDSEPIPVPEPTPIPGPDIAARLDRIDTDLQLLKASVSSLRFPDYETTVLGTHIVLTPKK